MKLALVGCITLSACARAAGPSASAPADISVLAGADALSMGQGTLYLLDGKRVTPATMTSFGQGDIANVEVIKPPAAEEIFGAEARGGIVRINTKARAIAPSVAGCKPPENPYFEFQVSRPAIYLTNDVKFPQPVSASASSMARGTGLIVQVVVDTAGFPEARSFKILRAPNEAAATAVRHAILGWRFIPAIFQGCKVPQLVQTEVTP